MQLGHLITLMWIHCFLFPFLSLYKRKPSQFWVWLQAWRPPDAPAALPSQLNWTRVTQSPEKYNAKLLLTKVDGKLPIASHCRPLWVAVAKSRRPKAGAATATAATLTLLWLKNLHKLLKVAARILLGNISERHFDASNRSFLPLRCLFVSLLG